MKEKERRKYQKKKEKGTRKLVKDMSLREHKAVKKVWKEHCSKFRVKKKVMKDITNTFIRENTPDSEDPAEERPTPLRSSESALVTARKKSVKKKREKILKEKDLKIQKYKHKVEKYKKSCKDNNSTSTSIYENQLDTNFHIRIIMELSFT
ncbi:hypothetical protein FQA39_LY02330 [Lamprigera yunnana]|nr:hypothetical protein FQA39_LY02330 [Lamprigera yunnana]